MFTHEKFERRSPEVKLTLCYRESEHDMITTITAIHTGNQYSINTEVQKYPKSDDELLNTQKFTMHAVELQSVFDYVALYFIKTQVAVEYNLLSPRFRDNDLNRSYILVSDEEDNDETTLSRMEEKLWRYLRLLKGVTVDDFFIESL